MNTVRKPDESAKVIYTTTTHTTGGREGGHSLTSDGRLDVKLATPGGPGIGTNPEQLFAVGWSACFTSAIKLIAFKQKVMLPPDMAVDTDVDLLSGNDGYALQVRHNVSLPGLDRKLGQSLIESAHEICPYSKATRGNINVELNLT